MDMGSYCIIQCMQCPIYREMQTVYCITYAHMAAMYNLYCRRSLISALCCRPLIQHERQLSRFILRHARLRLNKLTARWQSNPSR